MSNSVHHAIEGLLYGFTQYSGKDKYGKQLAELRVLFHSDQFFDGKVNALDEWLESNPTFATLEDYLFDLLMIHFIREEGTSEAFFDSTEWDRIEDEYADRGSELLEVLTYIDECKEIGVIPEIEDFIYEYLLTENDPDRETMQLYEPLIRHRELSVEIIENIVEETAHEKENDLGPMLQALLIYFSQPNEVDTLPAVLADLGQSLAEVSALTCCIYFYDKGMEDSNLH